MPSCGHCAATLIFKCFISTSELLLLVFISIVLLLVIFIWGTRGWFIYALIEVVLSLVMRNLIGLERWWGRFKASCWACFLGMWERLLLLWGSGNMRWRNITFKLFLRVLIHGWDAAILSLLMRGWFNHCRSPIMNNNHLWWSIFRSRIHTLEWLPLVLKISLFSYYLLVLH